MQQQQQQQREQQLHVTAAAAREEVVCLVASVRLGRKSGDDRVLRKLILPRREVGAAAIGTHPLHQEQEPPHTVAGFVRSCLVENLPVWLCRILMRDNHLAKKKTGTVLLVFGDNNDILVHVNKESTDNGSSKRDKNTKKKSGDEDHAQDNLFLSRIRVQLQLDEDHSIFAPNDLLWEHLRAVAIARGNTGSPLSLSLYTELAPALVDQGHSTGMVEPIRHAVCVRTNKHNLLEVHRIEWERPHLQTITEDDTPEEEHAMDTPEHETTQDHKDEVEVQEHQDERKNVEDEEMDAQAEKQEQANNNGATTADSSGTEAKRSNRQRKRSLSSVMDEEGEMEPSTAHHKSSMGFNPKESILLAKAYDGTLTKRDMKLNVDTDKFTWNDIKTAQKYFSRMAKEVKARLQEKQEAEKITEDQNVTQKIKKEGKEKSVGRDIERDGKEHDDDDDDKEEEGSEKAQQDTNVAKQGKDGDDKEEKDRDKEEESNEEDEDEVKEEKGNGEDMGLADKKGQGEEDEDDEEMEEAATNEQAKPGSTFRVIRVKSTIEKKDKDEIEKKDKDEDDDGKGSVKKSEKVEENVSEKANEKKDAGKKKSDKDKNKASVKKDAKKNNDTDHKDNQKEDNDKDGEVDHEAGDEKAVGTAEGNQKNPSAPTQKNGTATRKRKNSDALTPAATNDKSSLATSDSAERKKSARKKSSPAPESKRRHRVVPMKTRQKP